MAGNELLTSKETGLYGRLYDEMQSNFGKAGGCCSFYRNTLTANVGTHPRHPDISRMLSLDNQAFFQALFYAVYKRETTPREQAYWEPYFFMDTDAFRKKVINRFCGSSIAAIYHIEPINSPYHIRKHPLKFFFFGKLYALTDKSSLRSFGKKLPAPLQKIIRRVFI